MSRSHYRIEYVELTLPNKFRRFRGLARRPPREFDKLSELISEKCELLAPEGWMLSKVQTVPVQELMSSGVSAAAWLYFEQHPHEADVASATETTTGLLYTDVLARIESSFASIYMTITSIIQGVALAVLAQQVFGYITQVGVSNVEDWALIIPYAILSLIFVITVAFDYSSLIAVYRWTPRLSDVFFPFALGATQIGSAYFLTSPRAWWAANAMLATIGVFAFMHTWWRTKNEMAEYPKIVEYTRITTFRSSRLALTVVVLSICASVFYFTGPKIAYWYTGDLVFTAIYLIAICSLLWTQDQDIQPAEDSPYNLARQ